MLKSKMKLFLSTSISCCQQERSKICFQKTNLMVPLLIASGPGAMSRSHIGLVIATGLGIGTLFTLFVVPAFYVWLAGDHRPREARLSQEHSHEH